MALYVNLKLSSHFIFIISLNISPSISSSLSWLHTLTQHLAVTHSTLSRNAFVKLLELELKPDIDELLHGSWTELFLVAQPVLPPLLRFGWP